ncbi:helix-turn-helix transcriptional regulator [Gammaproteobacteria bacterium]|nr:helix-turn-helix transcriptional regulator [Gammaproteobacteria bacterium]
MKNYGQFCPVAKASELLGERWVLLILRELLLGTHRYSDFQRALSRISPSMLTKRLQQLQRAGIVVRKPVSSGKSHDYFLTPAGKELAVVIEHLAIWGMRWARGQLTDDELDVEFLMWDIQRRLQTDRLAAGETVLCFIFPEVAGFGRWWLVIQDSEVDLCTDNPGKDVDLYLTSSLRDMACIWEGDLDIRQAMREGLLKTQGSQQLARTLPDWLGINPYADVRRGDPEMMKVAADD